MMLDEASSRLLTFNIPWGQAVRADGTFKAADELKMLYGGKGLTPDKEIIAYYRIDERSSRTWFVLKYLLGHPNVRNYDGSWTEYGSLIDVPIEKCRLNQDWVAVSPPGGLHKIRYDRNV